MRRAPFVFVVGILLAGLRCQPAEVAKAAEQKKDVMDSGAFGSLVVASPSLGHLTMTPGACAAGGPQFFLGADFEDARAGLVFRFVLDPLEGPAFRLYAQAAPFEKSVVFRRGDCRTLQFSINPTTMRIDRVQDFRVSLELDCATARGDSVAGRLAASHCH